MINDVKKGIKMTKNKVVYSNSLLEQVGKYIKKDDYAQLYAIKREGFSHEKEYRLIDLYRFEDGDDAKNI